MKRIIIIFLAIFLLGCAPKYDPRLIGTWQSNRADTVAEAFKRDPAWHEAAPERIQRFRQMFGHMVVTYTKNSAVIEYKEEKCELNYTVIEKGEGFVVIKTIGGLDDQQDLRLSFSEDLSSYWIDSGWGVREKFDKISAGESRDFNPTR